MTFLDVAPINDQGLVATVNEDGRLGLVGLQSPLTPQEALLLRKFLIHNAWNLHQATGERPEIHVWRASAGRRLLSAQHQMQTLLCMEALAGALVFFGDYDRQRYYAGFTANVRQFLMVPAACYYARYRACLIARVAAEIQSEDPVAIAAAIDAGYEAQSADAPWPLVAQAHKAAELIAYWREVAGDEPLPGDQDDARQVVQLADRRQKAGQQ